MALWYFLALRLRARYRVLVPFEPSLFMRFALLLAAAAFVVGSAISQPLLTETFDYPVGDLLTDQGVENHNGDEILLTLTELGPTLTGNLPSAENSTIIERGLGSRKVAQLGFTLVSADSRNGDNTTSYTSFLVDGGSTNNSNVGFEDQVGGADEYKAMGFVQGLGTTTFEQSSISAPNHIPTLLGGIAIFLLAMLIVVL